MRTAWLCDFDGTVCPADVGHCFVKRFTTGGGPRHAELQSRWGRGELGHRELTEAECALLSCHADEARAFARDFECDPEFAPFARSAIASGDVVCVVSEGFDFYIDALLERAGLPDLPRSSNRARFDGSHVIPEFPNAARSCGRCGNCKGAIVREWAARGYRTVAVGDGLSDCCAAREANVVLARGSLLDWCRREGVPAHAVSSFAEIAAWGATPARDEAAARGDAPAHGGPA